ncbi:LXG domain of WXG superfamily protein [Bacillus sp. OV322]|uniref:LXG domain-containing protein n=1 Tax=Bacillus sp. OV322 TaxID=1882764 RepID=UPI0008E8D9D5|nr:LXG domain-containing protein [Bacillus sp. OV322]SFC27332.1 LXG domain of WXG superfamily protein [Bacillus sp. OV322]
MKILDVSSLQAGIEKIEKSLSSQIGEIEQLNISVMDFLTEKDSFSGKGGDAIRSFYEECHLPFLNYYKDVLIDYIDILRLNKKSLFSFESSQNGFIAEGFLSHELEQGIKKAKELTTSLTNETNDVIESVQSIITLNKLDDFEFRNGASNAAAKTDSVLDSLYKFDSESTKSLTPITNHTTAMNDYVNKISSMFNSKELSFSSYKAGVLYKKLNDQSLNDTISSKKASSILTNFEKKKTEEKKDLLTALKNGARGSMVPLAMMLALHKSGVLRIEYTKKKNHYAFKYNKAALKYLKGKLGPEWSKKLITRLNNFSKESSFIEKQLKKQKNGFPGAKNFKDTRTLAQKTNATLNKLITKNKPIHEMLKGKLIKNSTGDMLILKKAFPRIAAKTSGTGTAIIGVVTGIYAGTQRFIENNKKYTGEKRFEMNGRVVGEEVNKVAMSTAGAAAGTYIGAVIGGALTGPLAPIGAAAGAAIGGAIGASVGEWSTKYTKKWMSAAGAAVGKVTHSVKKKIAKSIDQAKDAVSDISNKVLGWI